MTKKEFAVISDYDGLRLKGIVFEPDGERKGVLQLVHGMCEYKERYEKAMEFFAERGFVVACHDQRGHGDSVEQAADRGWMRDFKGKAIVDDCVQITRYLKAEYPNLPLTLFGHSMGSMVVRCFLKGNDGLIDKLIVCGSPSKNPMVGAAIGLTKLIRLFRGERHRSKMLSYLSTGKGNDNFPGEPKGAWLSRNRESIQEFYGSEKGRYVFTCNGFENLFNLMKRTYTKKEYQVSQPNLPILFVSGGDDAVMVNEKKWLASVDFLRERGYTKVESKLYTGLRHEILNELDNGEVYADLLNFLEK